MELAHNYERLKDLERERTISAERERMTADMHDGIGGQLVHALAVVENNPQFQPMEPILRGALDDLRLIIDSADPMEGDLLVVLSNFRARNERRVQAGGLTFLWQVTRPARPARLRPSQDPAGAAHPAGGAHQRAQTCARHAGHRAHEHRGRCAGPHDRDRRRDRRWHGFRRRQVGNIAGRGFGNMRRRAQELGGSVELTATEKGSRLRLILPVIDRRHIAR